MKIYCLIAALLLAACATETAAPEKTAYDAFYEWHTMMRAELKAGKIKHSTFYEARNQRLSQLPDNEPIKPVLMAVQPMLLASAKAFEAGKISQDQFNDIKKKANDSIDASLHAREISLKAQSMQSNRRPVTAGVAYLYSEQLQKGVMLPMASGIPNPDAKKCQMLSADTVEISCTQSDAKPGQNK